MAKFYQPYLRDYKQSVEKRRASIPFGTDSTVAAPEYAPIGFDGDPEDTSVNYNLGWTLRVPAGSTLGRLMTPFTGALAYTPSDQTVTLYVTDPVLLNALRHLKPPWVKPPDRIVFKGLNSAAVEIAMRQQPSTAWEDTRTWDELVDDFLAGVGHIPARAGFVLTEPPTADRTYTILAYDDTSSPGHPLLLNLSWYIEQWPVLLDGLAGHSLESQMTAVDWPLWTSENTVRYVKASGVTANAHGGSADDYFKTVAKPAKSLAEAVQFAKPHDTILILDKSTYSEGEIVITKPLTIASTSKADPLDANFLPSSFPRIRPKGGVGRVIRIDGGAGSIAPVGLTRLTIENGAMSDQTQAVGGAGIAVIDEDRVYIDRCCIRNNKTSLTGFGDVSLVSIKAQIIGMLAAVNPDLVPLWNLISPDLPDKVPNHQLSGQLFGGGVCFGWSSGYMRRCLVRNNSASARGSGIAVVGYGWPVIDECHVLDNQSGLSGRRDGGGIALEVGIPERIAATPRVLTNQDLAEDLDRWLENLGPLDVAELALRFAGGAIVGDDLLPQICEAYIGLRKWDLWNEDDVKKARNSQVIVTNSRVIGNKADDDGGGLYASVLSRCVLKNCAFDENEARHGGGGGVRTSMGSDVTIVSCTINDNVAGSLDRYQGVNYPGAPGGGGIACRNATVAISGTADKPSSISHNTSTNWAGGGVTLEATSEGSLVIPKNEMWQAILTEVFDVDEMNVEILENVTIEQNQALHDTTYHHPEPKKGKPNGEDRGPHGWGGGIYMVRGEIDEVADLNVTIKGFANAVRNNIAKAGPLKKPDDTVRSATTNRFRLVDLENEINDGDDQMSAYLDGTTFEYEGD